ncbi:MAG: hypothetical protein Fur0044_21080 [Anaerolineae bacterium]
MLLLLGLTLSSVSFAPAPQTPRNLRDPQATDLGSPLIPTFASTVQLPTFNPSLAPLSSQWSAASSITHNATSGPRLAVSGHKVYAAWSEYRSEAHNISLSISPDGGQTWGAARPVTRYPQEDGYHIGGLQALAVDPTTGTIYVVYGVNQYEYPSLLRLARSSDGGLTWAEVSLPDLIPWPELLIDQSSRLYIPWQDENILTYSDDGGQTWSQNPLCAFCAAGDLELVGDTFYLAWYDTTEDRLRLSQSEDGGQTWLDRSPPVESLIAQLYPVDLSAAGPEQLYLAGSFYNMALGADETYVAASQDGGLTWAAPVQLDPYRLPRLAASGQGQLAMVWQEGNSLVLAESADYGQSWSQETLLASDFFFAQFDLAADPTSGTSTVAWYTGTGRITTASQTTAVPADCPAVELLSARRLDEQTIGVVGLQDMNTGVTTASLSAEGVAPVDILTLAQHNAVGGVNNPENLTPEELQQMIQSEGRRQGLWSASLHNPNGFGTTVSVRAEVTLPAIPNCLEPLLTVPSASPIQIKSIQTVSDTPDQDGLSLTIDSTDGSLPTISLSHYQFATTGIAGAWETVFTGPLPENGLLTVPGEFVTEGENLYRVMVEGQPGVEDIDGFYMPNTPNLYTDTVTQRRQALVFRDAVREVIEGDDDYVEIFPEELILAMGAAESNMNNAVANTDGIMQVTCDSGYKGATEEQACDTYAYTDTVASIKFNVSDALALLFDNYATAQNQEVNYPRFISCQATPTLPIPTMDDQDEPTAADALITAVLYYNGGGCYIDTYQNKGWGNPWYLHYLARQLDPQPDDPDAPDLNPNNPNAPKKNGWKRLPLLNDQELQNIAQFLADADYTPGIGLAPDLVERLDYGQNYVNQNMQ